MGERRPVGVSTLQGLRTVAGWLTPHDTFSDPATQHALGVVVTRIGYAGLAGFAIETLITVFHGDFAKVAPLTIPVALVMGLAVWLIRLKHVLTAVVLAILAVWSFIVAAVLRFDGSHDSAILVFPLLIVVSSLLLNLRFALIMTFASMVFVGAVSLAEASGWLHNRYADQGDLNGVDALIVIGVTGFFARFVIRRSIQAQERQRQSEERFRALIEHSNDMVAVLDEQAIPIYRSPAWVAGSAFAVLGSPPGRSILESIHPDDLPGIRASLAALKTPGSHLTGQTRWRHPDGSWRQMAWSARHAFAVPGVGGIIVNARDNTAELALQEQLQQARKMEAVGQLAGGIAHDFNNLIAAIQGFADLLLQDLPPDSAQHRFAERIDSASRRARDLVQQILVYARRSSVERKPVDLVPIIRETVELMHGSLPASTALVVDAVAAPLVAEVNPSQIGQVLVNLCLNAQDALAGRAGRITVSVGPADPTEIAEFGRGDPSADGGVFLWGALEPGAAYVRLGVADDGSGIPPDILPRICDPFFSTKQRARGTGLGLAVVHGIMMAYKGALRVDSRPGAGTIVRLYLRLADRSAGSNAGPDASTRAASELIRPVADDPDSSHGVPLIAGSAASGG